MAGDDIALMAHLLRRAGFGANRDELENYVAKRYEATVEELLHPENAPPALEEDLIRRFHVDENNLQLSSSGQTYWIYRMINTRRPLEEKLALFWHGLFATGYTKLNHPKAILRQIEMFRRYGMGSFHTLLVELSKDPAMIFFLDNKENHADAVNENYGREILELFSLGVGMDNQSNYTETDVRECSRAFTGWTMLNPGFHTARAERDSLYPYGRVDWQFDYRADDHDDTEKTFLGHQGRFNGEEIIDIICQQPATARFISRHLYNFFVAEEPQVPAWQKTPPRDMEAINAMTEAFVSSNYQIRPVLRVLFNSDFFKDARMAKVKGPAEFVVSTARLAGGYDFPDFNDIKLALAANTMGQQVLDPPSVEGWHTGKEWINTGSLVDRVNFVVDQLGDASKPGVRSIIERVKAQGPNLSPEELVDACLDFVGPITVKDSTRRELVDYATESGNGQAGSTNGDGLSDEKIMNVLRFVASTREFQLA